MSTSLPDVSFDVIGQSMTFFPPNSAVPKRGVQSFFLAGSIDQGNAPEWQLEMTEKLADKRVHIFNPRRKDWDPNLMQSIDSLKFVEQVAWELQRLEDVSTIAMYLAPNSRSPISLLELGLHLKSGNMVVGCDKEYLWHKHVEEYCRHNKDTSEHVATLEKLVGKIKAIQFKPHDEHEKIEGNASPSERADGNDDAIQSPPIAIAEQITHTAIHGQHNPGPKMVFLGGTIFVGSQNDWRVQLTQKISHIGGNIIPPVGEEKHSHEMSTEELQCKISGIEKSDLAVIYLTRDPEDPNRVDPAPLLELGALLKSGKVVVACEEDYPRQANVVLTCDRYNVPVFRTFEFLEEEVIRRLGYLSGDADGQEYEGPEEDKIYHPLKLTTQA